MTRSSRSPPRGSPPPARIGLGPLQEPAVAAHHTPRRSSRRASGGRVGVDDRVVGQARIGDEHRLARLLEGGEERPGPVPRRRDRGGERLGAAGIVPSGALMRAACRPEGGASSGVQVAERAGDELVHQPAQVLDRRQVHQHRQVAAVCRARSPRSRCRERAPGRPRRRRTRLRPERSAGRRRARCPAATW